MGRLSLVVGFVFCSLVLLPSQVSAKPKSEKKVKKPAVVWKPTFSSEITFGSEAQAADAAGIMKVMTESNMEALENYYDKAMELLAKRKDVKSVEYEEAGDKFGADLIKVRYKDGWGYDVTLDPECLEVILKPFSMDQMDKAFEKRVQKDVFDIMKHIGLDPRVKGGEVGGGHVHAGMLSTFGVDNVRLLRNQVVDFANHPELGLGAMDDDPENSKSLIQMKKAQRDALAKWVRRVDEGHFDTVRKAATALVKDVLLEGKPATAKQIMAGKYWALNFLRMGYIDTWDTLDPNRTWTDYIVWTAFDEVDRNARTLEFRALRAPRTAAEMTKNIKLIEARLRYLNEIDRNIPLHPKFVEGKRPTTEEKVEMFYKWVKATGLNPMDYFYMLPANRGEVRDYKDWHKHFLKLAHTDGLGDSVSFEASYCKASLGKVWKNAGLSRLRSIR